MAEIRGGVGDDLLFGTADADSLWGEEGNDDLDGGGGSDTLYGGAGNDYLHDWLGADTLDGGDGDDLLQTVGKVSGQGEADVLDGGAGNDWLSVLSGGLAHTLLGGSGADIFSFGLPSNAGDPNDTLATLRIVDFNQAEGDRIDLGRLNMQAGNWVPSLLRGSAPVGFAASLGEVVPGAELGDGVVQVWTIASGDKTVLFADVDRDHLVGAADLRVELNGAPTLDLASFTGGFTDRVSVGQVTYVFGSAAAELLSGSAGIDIIDGGAGDDTITGYGGGDLLYGGAGNDQISSGFTFPISTDGIHADGGDGDDLIFGSAGNDTLYGGAGSDTLLGIDGDDQLWADGTGTDAATDVNFLHGGLGNDVLYGGSGIDTLDGGEGDDALSVQLGSADRLIGGTGADIFQFIPAAAVVLTTVSIDDFNAQEGDLIDLGRFVDAAQWPVTLMLHSAPLGFDASEGSAAPVAEGSPDALHAWRGTDGNGNSLLYVDANRNATVDAGDLRLSLNWAYPFSEDFALSSAIDRVVEVGTEGADALYGSFGDDTLDGLGGDDYVDGSDFGRDSLWGGAGNDWLSAHGAPDGLADTLDGGAGDDRLAVRDRSALHTLTGGAGADVFVFSAGDLPAALNPIRITDFDTSAGDRVELFDLFRSPQWPSDPTYYPGLLRGEAPAGFTATLGQALPGAELGTGVTQIWTFAQDGSTMLFADLDRDFTVGTADLLIAFDGAPAITRSSFAGGITDRAFDGQYWNIFGTDLVDALYGTTGDDRIFGEAGDDTIDGAGGADFLYGGAGNDFLIGAWQLPGMPAGPGIVVDGGLGDDFGFGGGGDDTVHGGGGSDRLGGGGGNDVLWAEGSGSDAATDLNHLMGDMGDDHLHGGRGIDTLDGGDGDDRLSVAVGSADQLTGGSGADTFAFDRGTSADGTAQTIRITDFNPTDGDRLDIGGLLQPGQSAVFYNPIWPPAPSMDGDALQLWSSWEFNNLVLYADVNRNGAVDGDDLRVIVDGVPFLSVDHFTGGVSLATYHGTAQADSIYGSPLEDLIDGGAGDDFIDGMWGHDRLWGGEGDDQLFGGEGNDRIDAGNGFDAVYAGAGDDEIDITGGTGSVTVAHGESGRDTFRLGGQGALAVILDFVPGAQGDVVDVASLVAGVPAGANPFDASVGVLRLMRDGADTLIEWDANGAADSSGTGWHTVARLVNVDPSILAVANFGGTEGITSLRIVDPRPLVAAPIADQQIAEDALWSFTLPAGTFEDGDDGEAALLLVATQADGNALPAWLSFDPLTRAFSGTPANADVGRIDVRVTAIDPDGTSVADVFGLTIANVNDAPTAGNDSASTVANVPVTIAVLANDADVDAGNVLGVSSVAQPAHGVVSIDASGQLVYTPLATWNGTDTFTYTVSDGQGGTASASVSVVVAGTIVGTDAANKITGTSASNSIEAKGGNDTVDGGAGNDFVSGGAGDDKLTGGAGNDALVGGDGNDTLLGGAGGDILVGGAGNDALYGNAANGKNDLMSDTFVFNAPIGAGRDTVYGFEASGIDKIALDPALFAALLQGPTSGVDSGEFRASAGGQAADANDYLLYDTATGNLYYDADGNGAGARIWFATLSGAAGTVDATDFTLVPPPLS
jgi:Ca2+-binding RTX toxin-like protein